MRIIKQISQCEIEIIIQLQAETFTQVSIAT